MAVTLPNGRQTTSSLGLGCAYMAGGLDSGDSVRLISAALDCGYRHLDVAPLYGRGTAEDAVGRALKGRRDSVTLATKVGFERPAFPLYKQAARMAAKPLRRSLAAIRAKAPAASSGSSAHRTNFNPAWVAGSVEDSLRQLKTDYLDLLLLHEVRAEDLTDELMRWLEDGKAKGLFLAVGVASEYSAAKAIQVAGHAFDVYQFSRSFLDVEQAPFDGAFTITHRALLGAYDRARDLLVADPALRRELERDTDLNLADGDDLSLVLLGFALEGNRDGVVLAASRGAARIRSNARAMNDPRYRDAGRRLGPRLRAALAGGPR